ncbi:hypothetical protein EVAR_26776_1 [Eumeta japonica]|uniref:Uncharacterized protein n=1 Tax=Eumeta variegata TaxID=151549 RepID=A0A4C1XF46_EUMVA|nr:hypothetical protein EVAR_26776_1 [Eumeta japonica]
MARNRTVGYEGVLEGQLESDPREDILNRVTSVAVVVAALIRTTVGEPRPLQDNRESTKHEPDPNNPTCEYICTYANHAIKKKCYLFVARGTAMLWRTSLRHVIEPVRPVKYYTPMAYKREVAVSLASSIE